MKTYTYSNDYETYEIVKIDGRWVVMQDGIFADTTYSTLKEAKIAIDNQQIYF